VALPGEVPIHWTSSRATPISRPWPASEPFGALQAVQDRVAVRVQGAGGAGGAELLADVHAQRVAQFAVGPGERAERPGDELAGALFVGEGEADQLDVGEPGHPQVRPPGHQPADTEGPRSTRSVADPVTGVAVWQRLSASEAL